MNAKEYILSQKRIPKTQYDCVLLIKNKSILTASYTAVSGKRVLLFQILLLLLC